MNIYRRGDETSPPRECFQFGVRDGGGFHTSNELGQGIDADGLTAGGEGFDECGPPAWDRAWVARFCEGLGRTDSRSAVEAFDLEFVISAA